MQTGLRIKLEEALKAKYPGYLTLDEAEQICKQYRYKMSNLERRTRNDRKAQGSNVKCEKIKNAKGVIIGYKWIQSDMIKIPITGTVNSRTGVINFDKEKTKSKMEQLDEQLNELEKKYGGEKAWQNYEIIRNIREAKKSMSEYLKESTIKKYG